MSAPDHEYSLHNALLIVSNKVPCFLKVRFVRRDRIRTERSEFDANIGCLMENNLVIFQRTTLTGIFAFWNLQSNTGRIYHSNSSWFSCAKNKGETWSIQTMQITITVCVSYLSSARLVAQSLHVDVLEETFSLPSEHGTVG